MARVIFHPANFPQMTLENEALPRRQDYDNETKWKEATEEQIRNRVAILKHQGHPDVKFYVEK